MVVDKPLFLKKEAKIADTYTLREKALPDTWLKYPEVECVMISLYI